ncbi:MAG TPA: transcriptional regulator NrdR [Candidatus Megamonas gallistercoris]|nr:transcriptional regulator NrdR [Candidatus Megamonas gallistercoris]
MKCPFCAAPDSRVVDSRTTDDGNSIRRRRECTVCGKRFTTYEAVEKVPLMVIKNDGRRAVFDKEKLLKGIIRSCYKRDIPAEKIIKLADEIEKELRNMMRHEISSKTIGEVVMKYLKTFDKVAYIRFASVYRKFSDIDNFKQELENLNSVNKDKN